MSSVIGRSASRSRWPCSPEYTVSPRRDTTLDADEPVVIDERLQQLVDPGQSLAAHADRLWCHARHAMCPDRGGGPMSDVELHALGERQLAR